MKKNVVIIFLFLMSLLAAETTKVSEQIYGPRRPLYEKTPLISDYRINQPMKGAIRWGMVFSFSEAIINSRLSTKNSNFYKYTSHMGEFGLLSGALLGLYKGYIAQNKKKNNPNYMVQPDNFGYELDAIFKSTEGNSFTTIGNRYLTYNYKYKFIDELQFGLATSRLLNFAGNSFTYKERKYDLQALHYYRKGFIFSPFYVVGCGLSHGKRLDNEQSEDNHHVISQGIYPFVHSSVGIRFSFFDFFFLKLKTDFELSSFYFYVNSFDNYPFIKNVGIGLVFGTKIF
ncbi:MAG: hypothetical protein KAS53_05195 [Candidatus Cloacimonetes bacterium]|nr:hypothetical protein [Candidatus Cloacimonadota bacterium]